MHTPCAGARRSTASPAADSELRGQPRRATAACSTCSARPRTTLRVDTTPVAGRGRGRARGPGRRPASYRALPRQLAAARARRRYADGTSAELALDDRRLVWRVTYDGRRRRRLRRVRRRAVRARPAHGQPGQDRRAGQVWENYPGAGLGGDRGGAGPRGQWLTREHRDRRAWPERARLLGRPNDDDVAALGEEVVRPLAFDLNTSFAPVARAARSATPCTWDDTRSTRGGPTGSQSAIQAFYLVNLFHDWLAAPRSASAAGASTASTGCGARGRRSRPARLVNNANMSTPPDGIRRGCRCTC